VKKNHLRLRLWLLFETKMPRLTAISKFFPSIVQVFLQHGETSVERMRVSSSKRDMLLSGIYQ